MGHAFGTFEKPSEWVRFYGDNFVIFRPKVQEIYWVLSNFCHWKFNKINKASFGRRNELSDRVYTQAKGTSNTSWWQQWLCVR